MTSGARWPSRRGTRPVTLSGSISWEGNGESFQHARRQWSLRDNTDFYAHLSDLDGALMRSDEDCKLLASNRGGFTPTVHHCKDDSGVLAFHVEPTARSLTFTRRRVLPFLPI